MKVTIITVTHNSASTLTRTLESVAEQSHARIEHIIVDGGSTDETVQIAESFPHIKKVISEKDKGIYDALNKGLDLAQGEIIGLLHSDDVFSSPLSLARVVSAFVEKPELDGVYADIQFVNPQGKTTRYYSSKNWKFADFAQGMMPAHPSFFARKDVYEGERFSLDYKIASDFELLVRLFSKPKWTFKYIPFTITDMAMGGASTRSIRSNFIINREIRQICKKHGIKTSYFKIYSKYFRRILELKI